MSTLSLRLPDYLHKKIKEIAKDENISINQFIASAVSEKMAAFTTLEYLEARAKRSNDKKFEKVIKKIPSSEPEEFDECFYEQAPSKMSTLLELIEKAKKVAEKSQKQES